MPPALPDLGGAPNIEDEDELQPNVEGNEEEAGLGANASRATGKLEAACGR